MRIYLDLRTGEFASEYADEEDTWQARYLVVNAVVRAKWPVHPHPGPVPGTVFQGVKATHVTFIDHKRGTVETSLPAAAMAHMLKALSGHFMECQKNFVPPNQTFKVEETKEDELEVEIEEPQEAVATGENSDGQGI